MHSSAEKISILIVDDHAFLREGIRAMIKDQPDLAVVGEAADGAEAIRQFRALLPNITLTDIHLPVICGIEAMSMIRSEFPQARFIVVSALDDADRTRQAFAAGAQAFLHKDMLRKELLPAIRAVHRGKQYAPRQILGAERPRQN